MKKKKQEIKNNDKEEESKAQQKISFDLDIKKEKMIFVLLKWKWWKKVFGINLKK